MNEVDNTTKIPKAQIEAVRKELERLLRFQTLLAEISSRFVNLPAEQVDGEIEGAQRRMCELLDLDRSTLWQVSKGESMPLVMTHIYQAQGPPPPTGRLIDELFPWTRQKVLAGETVIFTKTSDLPSEAGRDRESYGLIGTKSDVIVPLSVGGEPPLGLLTFAVMREERDWPEEVVKGFQLIAQVFANAFARKRADEQLKKHLLEIENLKQRLEKENIYLQEEVRLLVDHTEIVGQSTGIKRVLMQAEQVAATDSFVLIMGETGTGKELLARAIHRMSVRKGRPLVTVNCASLPPTLIESELFGREKGAYTGAMTKMIGRFEVADGSTLFLDEIGELPFELQSKLLRVLEEGVLERLGSTRPMKVNLRLITATNRDLAEDVRAGKFRKDLYYRLNVFPITIPPLRERPEDIPLMVWTFVNEFQQKMGKRIETISRKSMEAMQSYPWPGNVRELRNAIERAMITTRGVRLEVALLGMASRDAVSEQNLQDLERSHILKVLERTRWKVTGKGSAAEILGLKASTLRSRMEKLGIKRPTN